eukprot:20903_1
MADPLLRTPPPISINSPPLLMMDKDMLRLSRHNLLQPLMFGASPHHSQRRHSDLGQSPIKKVIFNMLNNILGAGVIALPYVFSTCGLSGGLLLMFLFSFISAYSLRLLMISAAFCKQRNYEDLCEYLFGAKGYIFVSTVLFIFDFGASLSYLIILGDAASQIIAIWGYNTLFHRQMAILCLSICLIFPTVLPRDISKIEKISAVSVLSVVLIMLMVVYEWIAHTFVMSHGTPHGMKWGIDPNGLPMAIGIIAFSFVCHDSSFLLYKTLKNPTIRRWTILAYSGSFISVSVCACFAISGYLTFGSSVKDNILNNYDTHDKVVIGARFLYCITMALTYPGSFFVVRHVTYVIFHHGPQYESIRRAPLSKHLLFTIPLFAVNVLMAIYIQNLGIVMSVSGSLSAVILAFCLPPVCYLKICKYKIRFWKEREPNAKWLAFKTTFPPFLLCVFGALIAVFSTSFTILQHFGLRFI